MVICSPQLGLSPKSALGGEVFDREILLGLAKKGVEIEIILSKDKTHEKNVKNWQFNYLPLSHFPPQFFNFLIIPYLFKINRKKKIQIIRLHQPQFTGFAALLFKLFHPKVKIVATYHQFKESKFPFISKTINGRWDHIICDSLYVKNLIISSFKIPPGKITVVHNGVPLYLGPTKKDSSWQKKLRLEGQTALLFMGLFIDRKNPLFLLKVLSEISKKHPHVTMIFWGKGPLKETMTKMAKDLGLTEKIRIVDPIFGPEKNKIHNLCDIFVHPASDEGFALAPLEAMACAKPIVMTDGYSASEAVDDGVNGFLCRPNDLNHWSKKLSELIDDSGLRNKMGQASFQKAKNEFQWQLAVQKHLEVFKGLINETN